MATRPATASHRGARVDWRAALKRAARRSAEIGGALALLGAMVFLALALVTYRQTDPSASTAAGGPVVNWMGALELGQPNARCFCSGRFACCSCRCCM